MTAAWSWWRKRGTVGLSVAILLVVVAWMCGSTATAALGAPAWTIRSLNQPGYFSQASNAACEAARATRACDSYTLIATNVGGGSTSGRISIADELPAGLKVVDVRGEDLDSGVPLECEAAAVQCSYESAVAPEDELLMNVYVTVSEPTSESVLNHGSVAGGGAAAATVSRATTVSSSQVPFGIADFNMQLFAETGLPSLQAGGHPFDMLTSFDLNTTAGTYGSPEAVRDVVVDLPVGLLGNPLAAPRCTLHALEALEGETLCPRGSRVGTVIFRIDQPGEFPYSASNGSRSRTETSALYNIEPEAGYPAEFGFTYLLRDVLIYANLARVNGHYTLRTVSPGIPTLGTTGATLLFFGNPAERDGGNAASRAFFTNPVDCSAEPLKASIRADSWQHPARQLTEYTSPLGSVVYPDITGCNMLEFQPALEATPDTTQADEPVGYGVKVKVPQNESPGTPGTPELRNATVTLPPGITLSPSAAEGLRPCREAGSEGINIEGSEAVEIGDGARNGSSYHDGQEHLAPGHCPAASTVGDVEVTTPVLPNPLQGHLFLAEPKCGGAGQPECTEADATNGNLFGVYLEASGAGAIVKLRGTVSADPQTGRLKTTFSENPQLPFGELTVHIKGGPRAALANPQTCGQATTTSDLTPWSAPTTPDATPFNSFTVDWDGNGGGCPAGGMPLSPSFSAGTVSPAAAGFSPFTLTLSRGDREQDLAQIAVHTPPGLLGMLSSVSLCGEPQATAGTCSAASQIGSTIVAAGSGSHPFWVQGGRVYLTGPYKGAPFGLSIVVPAVAGPFNLGNVVVRATINADPSTTALTVTSDPLPQILDGVPLRVRTVNVTIDRPGFMFNPTNCSKQQIAGTVAGAQGALAPVSSPFTAIGCTGLPFKTKFAVSTQAGTSKKNGASLDVKVTDAPGQANIAKVAVTLPKQLPSRLTTIQHACPAAVFAANPATCDPQSAIGIATGVSPVLPVTLTGPAYLVSHGGAAFPDVVLVIQGEGVRVDLIGNVNIKKGITSSTFASVPDVPINSFELRLPESPHSALTTAGLPAGARGSLCGQKLVMPTVITAQSGAQIKQSTKIAVTGCPKAKKKTGKKANGRRARKTAMASGSNRGGSSR